MCLRKAAWRSKAIRARLPTWTKCGEPIWDFRASSVADSSKETYPRDRASTPETDIAPLASVARETSSPTKVATRPRVVFVVGFFFPLTSAESATYESYIRLSISPCSHTQCDQYHIQA